MPECTPYWRRNNGVPDASDPFGRCRLHWGLWRYYVKTRKTWKSWHHFAAPKPLQWAKGMVDSRMGAGLVAREAAATGSFAGLLPTPTG